MNSNSAGKDGTLMARTAAAMDLDLLDVATGDVLDSILGDNLTLTALESTTPQSISRTFTPSPLALSSAPCTSASMLTTPVSSRCRIGTTTAVVCVKKFLFLSLLIFCTAQCKCWFV